MYGETMTPADLQRQAGLRGRMIRIDHRLGRSAYRGFIKDLFYTDPATRKDVAYRYDPTTAARYVAALAPRLEAFYRAAFPHAAVTVLPSGGYRTSLDYEFDGSSYEAGKAWDAANAYRSPDGYYQTDIWVCAMDDVERKA